LPKEKSADNSEKEEERVDVRPLKTMMTSKCPSTRLAASEDGEFLAIGDSAGDVVIIDTKSFSKIGTVSCHDDCPVTGLAFFPNAEAKRRGLRAMFASCSFNKSMSTVTLKNYAAIYTAFVYLVLLSILVFINYHIIGIRFSSIYEMMAPRVKNA